MKFEKWSVEQYRSADAAALAKRRDDIKAELRNKDSEFTLEELTAEVDKLEDAEKRSAAAAKLDAAASAAQTRAANAAAVADGAGAVVSAAQAIGSHKGTFEVVRSEDPFDTEAYNRAFMDYVTRGAEYPAGLVMPGQRPANVRADAFTATTDVQHFIPTTLANTIIQKMTQYGDIWDEVTKVNVKGGYEISVWDYLPTASWVTEAKPSDTQKVTDSTRISFLYHMLECKIAQTFLSGLVTLDMFTAQFPDKVAEAMVRALEQGIVNGSGSGQPLGILKDTRVTNKVTLAEADIAKYPAWAKLLSSVPVPYRSRGKFYMSQNTWDAYIDGMVDSNGQPISRVNYGGVGGANDTTYRLLGKPVKIVPDDILPDYDAAKGGVADAPFMLFGQLSDYIVNMQSGMRAVKWLDEDKNLEKLKMQVVADGKMGDTNGMLVINAPKRQG